MDEKDIEHRLTEAEIRLDGLERRQDNLDDIVTTVKVLADREERVEVDVKEIKDDVKMLASKSGKLWDSMIEKIMLIIVAAVVGYIVGQIGL